MAFSEPSSSKRIASTIGWSGSDNENRRFDPRQFIVDRLHVTTMAIARKHHR